MAIRTLEGLPVVGMKAFGEFAEKYPFCSENNDIRVTNRIKEENPQIYRIMEIGMRAASNMEARIYYEAGIQVCYELLRIQSKILKEQSKK